jgi:hypothetical protein
VPVSQSSERSLAAKVGAHALHSQYDGRYLTAAARAKWFERFVDQVDPDRTLPEPERFRRAEHARDSYMAALALKSAKARRRRKETP